jgi:hypothetical protein
VLGCYVLPPSLSCELDVCVQVWYSAAWSTATRSSFQAAVSSTLSALEHASEFCSHNVATILQRWLQATVSLPQARRSWSELSTDSMCFVANFLHSEDQLSLCDYMLTGQLLDASVGSTLMFVTPPKGELVLNLNMLATIPQKALVNGLREGTGDVVAVAVKVLRQRVQALRYALVGGNVSIEVRSRQVHALSLLLQSRS